MKKGLSVPEREFLALVAEAAFTNPFSRMRDEIDIKLAGTIPGTAPEQVLEVLLGRIGKYLAQLQKQGLSKIEHFSGRDREIINNVFLFDTFHRFIGAMDGLIREQLAAGDNSCPVPFATELLGLLVQRGFPSVEAERYFAIFYQMRRAFYFIQQRIVGGSPCMRELRMKLWNNIFTANPRWYDSFLWDRMEDFSTLLLGPTGTGKGTAAVAIGCSGFIPFDSKRNCFAESFARAFTAVNLSQFSESLIESELFGHKKGAFTGAIDHYDGIFTRCSPYGSILLDEIGELAGPIQIKLLKVLEERTFTPVGSHEQLRFSGRVIVATNRSLEELRGGLFRDDFFYRLCSDVIQFPTLQERLQEDPKELDALLTHLLETLTGNTTPATLAMLKKTLQRDTGRDYEWPGNVRELEQAVRRILLTGHYRAMASRPDKAQLANAVTAGTVTANELLSGYCRQLYVQHGTFEAVAKITDLDRRTVKKYIEFRGRGIKGSRSQEKAN